MKYFRYIIMLFSGVASFALANDTQPACEKLFAALFTPKPHFDMSLGKDVYSYGEDVAVIEKLLTQCNNPATVRNPLAPFFHPNETFLHSILGSPHPQKEALIDVSMKYGLDVNAQDNYGRSPLHHATGGNNPSPIMKSLLKHGANSNIQDKFGDTPLHGALKNGPLSKIKLLLDSGADIAIKNNRGETPLSIANSMDKSILRDAMTICCPYEILARIFVRRWIFTPGTYEGAWRKDCVENRFFLAPLVESYSKDSPLVRKIKRVTRITKNILSILLHR